MLLNIPNNPTLIRIHKIMLIISSQLQSNLQLPLSKKTVTPTVVILVKANHELTHRDRLKAVEDRSGNKCFKESMI